MIAKQSVIYPLELSGMVRTRQEQDMIMKNANRNHSNYMFFFLTGDSLLPLSVSPSRTFLFPPTLADFPPLESVSSSDAKGSSATFFLTRGLDFPLAGLDSSEGSAVAVFVALEADNSA